MRLLLDEGSVVLLDPGQHFRQPVEHPLGTPSP